jgi:GcrA cell cycle regulator
MPKSRANERIWNSTEIKTVLDHWQTKSASEIAVELHRSRSSIMGKVIRLTEQGLLQPRNKKHYSPRPRALRTTPPKTIPPLPATIDGLAIQPCTLIELDDRRCRWPIGETYAIAALFCGGAQAAGCSYCAHLLRLARA